MRYQAALRPEPLGSNTRTIASQPTIVRISFFFDYKFMRQHSSSRSSKLPTSIFEVRAAERIPMDPIRPECTGCGSTPRRSQLTATSKLHLSDRSHSEIASGGAVATCKSALSRRKMAQFETSSYTSSQKEKKIWRCPVGFVSIFSRHKLCFSYSLR